MRELSDYERSRFYQYIGRPIADQYISVSTIRNLLAHEDFEAKCAKRYSRDVWSKRSRADYIVREANACADFAFDLLSAEKKPIRTYSLLDAGGRPSSQLGHVHFRFNALSPSVIGLEITPENTRRIITIESIWLHPSMRRHGYLYKLINALQLRDFLGLVLSNIANPSLAYYLYIKSQENDRIILVSGQQTVAFETSVSPCPSFVLKL